MDASGFHGNVNVYLLNDWRGGGKRARVSVQEMRARDDDVPGVAAIFSMQGFNIQQWIGTLSPDRLKAYSAAMEAEKTEAGRITMTVSHVLEYTTMKVSMLKYTLPNF